MVVGGACAHPHHARADLTVSQGTVHAASGMLRGSFVVRNAGAAHADPSIAVLRVRGREIKRFAGGPVGGQGHGAVLPDDRAYTLFQHYCSYGFASQFKLYKLYTRAAAFTP